MARVLRGRKISALLIALTAITPGFCEVGSVNNGLSTKNFKLEVTSPVSLGMVTLSNRLSGKRYEFCLTAPELQFDEGTVGGKSVMPNKVTVRPRDARMEFSFPRQEMSGHTVEQKTTLAADKRGLLHISSSATVTGKASTGSLTLRKVTLMDQPLSGPIVFSQDGWQSYPVLTDDLFLGIEWPVGTATAKDGRVSLSYQPWTTHTLGRIELRPVVVGATAPGDSLWAFRDYIAEFRPQRDRIHFNYNSWWTLGFPFTAKELLDLYAKLDAHLIKPYRVHFDTCTLDLGWSEREAIWQVSRKGFPQGLAPVNAALDKMGSRIGIWWSPSNSYTPDSFDSEWAGRAGYETRAWWSPNSHCMCIAKGTRYQQEALKAITSLVKENNVKHLKFDAFQPECPETTHGHPAGELAREASAEGLIEIFRKVRHEAPDLWMEVHCFGPTPSPWWQMFVDSLVTGIGDDAPNGVVPAPVYRESYVTSRDFFNLHSARFPLAEEGHDLFGLIHQTTEPLYNDGVMALLRGNQFMSFYLKPENLASPDWRFVAELIMWGRANWDLLRHTHMILPEEWEKHGITPYGEPTTMPREPYGYAHWRKGEILLAIRNPWMDTQKVSVQLDRSHTGYPERFSGWSAWQLWPYSRCVARDLGSSGSLDMIMGPYETRVISLTSDRSRSQSQPQDPLVQEQRALRCQCIQSTMTIVNQEGTTPVRSWNSMVRGQCKAAGGGELYYLVESRKDFVTTATSFVVNGKTILPTIIDSETGWSAAQPGWKQNRWKWFVVPVDGEFECSANIDMQAEQPRCQAWLVASFAPEPQRLPKAVTGDPPFPTFPGYKAMVSVPAVQSLTGK